ncbi:MAG TPA: VOC family protein, partial [Saprospiraceae bacterium]|nr:VOC family protein [Saprospiraceae bacterium]
MELVKNAINWFEVPVLDFDRAKKFYEHIFDFEMPVMEMGPVKMGVFLYEQQPDSVGGAICFGDGYRPAGADGPKIYFNGGNDLNVVLSRVEAAGGKITMPKGLISEEIGYMAFFTDTEGN